MTAQRLQENGLTMVVVNAQKGNKHRPVRVVTEPQINVQGSRLREKFCVAKPVHQINVVRNVVESEIISCA